MAREWRPPTVNGGPSLWESGAITSANGCFPALIGFPGVLVAVAIGVTVPAVPLTT